LGSTKCSIAESRTGNRLTSAKTSRAYAPARRGGHSTASSFVAGARDGPEQQRGEKETAGDLDVDGQSGAEPSHPQPAHPAGLGVPDHCPGAPEHERRVVPVEQRKAPGVERPDGADERQNPRAEDSRESAGDAKSRRESAQPGDEYRHPQRRKRRAGELEHAGLEQGPRARPRVVEVAVRHLAGQHPIGEMGHRSVIPRKPAIKQLAPDENA
jgi:hypothetical protein